MAARVGSAVTGSGDGASSSIAASAKSTTTGNAICVGAKWEVSSGGALSNVQDTAGNTYTIVSQSLHGNGSLMSATAYCKNGTGNAANIVTANFADAGPVFRRIVVEEASGLATTGGTDGEAVNTGTGTTYSTGAIATSAAGWVFGFIAGFQTLTGKTAGGTPVSSLGGSLSDAFNTYLVSGSAQSVTPGASATESNDWTMRAFALSDVASAAPRIIHPTQSISMM